MEMSGNEISPENCAADRGSAASSVIMDPPVAASICLALNIIRPLYCRNFYENRKTFFSSAGAFFIVLLGSIDPGKSTSPAKGRPVDGPPDSIFEGVLIAEIITDPLYLLIFFMAFARYQHYISRRSQFYSHADGNIPVGYYNIVIAFYTSFYIFYDRLGVLVPRIVR